MRVRWLPVDYASHGPAVDAVAQELAAGAGRAHPGAGPGAVLVGGDRRAGWTGRSWTAAYWAANLREPVRFEEVVRGLAGRGHGVFVEVSPHPVLVTAVEQTLAGGRDRVRRWRPGRCAAGDGGPGRLLASAAEVFVRGVPVDWAAVFAGSGARRVDLPTYAFQRQRYWPAPRPAAGRCAGGRAGGGGSSAAGGGGGAGRRRRGACSPGGCRWRRSPWLADHAVFGTVLVPGTALVELAAWAGGQAGCPRVQELTLEAPLVLPDEGGGAGPAPGRRPGAGRRAGR